MKNNLTKAACLIAALGMTLPALAGNKDRTGQAGATELLINPWARSAGVFGLDVAHLKGIEAMKVNIAGLSGVQKTEVGLAHTTYLQGSGVTVINGAIAQKLGDFGVLGFNVMSMNFGEIPVTEVNSPDGVGTGTYKPQFLNIELGFAKKFSNAISAGVAVTFVSEQISSAKASAAAFEGGVQYTTGKRDNFHFGVTLRNVGTNMRFSGQVFGFNTPMPENSTNQEFNGQVPTEKFELPTYLNFGVSYDFYLDENRLKDENDEPKHRATAMADFTSNSFNNDHLGLGIEYAYREMFMIRGAYRYEKGISGTDATTFYTGFAAGATIQHAIGENGPVLAIDYAFRPTAKPNNGVHTVSLRLMSRGNDRSSD